MKFLQGYSHDLVSCIRGGGCENKKIKTINEKHTIVKYCEKKSQFELFYVKKHAFNFGQEENLKAVNGPIL